MQIINNIPQGKLAFYLLDDKLPDFKSITLKSTIAVRNMKPLLPDDNYDHWSMEYTLPVSRVIKIKKIILNDIEDKIFYCSAITYPCEQDVKIKSLSLNTGIFDANKQIGDFFKAPIPMLTNQQLKVDFKMSLFSETMGNYIFTLTNWSIEDTE